MAILLRSDVGTAYEPPPRLPSWAVSKVSSIFGECAQKVSAFRPRGHTAGMKMSTAMKQRTKLRTQLLTHQDRTPVLVSVPCGLGLLLRQKGARAVFVAYPSPLTVAAKGRDTGHDTSAAQLGRARKGRAAGGQQQTNVDSPAHL